MDIVYERCAGLDVHKKTVVACRLLRQADGHWQQETRTFGTMTVDLLALADWLRAGEVQKVLEDANIKLSSVATDVMGVSARDMLTQIIQGQTDPQILADLARGRMRAKLIELERALTGRIHAQHRLLLSLHLEHIDDHTTKLERLSREIETAVAPFDQTDELERLDEIPGVGPEVAQGILAELGNDMTRFPNRVLNPAVSLSRLGESRVTLQARGQSRPWVAGGCGAGVVVSGALRQPAGLRQVPAPVGWARRGLGRQAVSAGVAGLFGWAGRSSRSLAASFLAGWQGCAAALGPVGSVERCGQSGQRLGCWMAVERPGRFWTARGRGATFRAGVSRMSRLRWISSAIASQGSTRTQVEESSTPSGIPSTNRQMRPTADWCALVKEKPC